MWEFSGSGCFRVLLFAQGTPNETYSGNIGVFLNFRGDLKQIVGCSIRSVWSLQDVGDMGALGDPLAYVPVPSPMGLGFRV